MKNIFIQALPSEKFALVTENNEVQHFTVDRYNQKSLVGNIYLGRVARIDHSLQAAFIDFGEKKLGYLSKKELPALRREPKKQIENFIHEGMSILIQVIKDPYSDKGAMVSANITLPGQYFIYMPYSNYIATSKRMNEKQKERYKTIVNQWVRAEEGAIIRTSVLSGEEESLKKEWFSLSQQWQQLFQKSQSLKAPHLLFQDNEIPHRFLRKYAVQHIDEIIVDESSLAQEMKKTFPQLANKIRWSDSFVKELPISLHHFISNLISRTVRLPSGIELYIDKTEACTVIDVNTASYIGKQNKNQTVLHANLEAAKEIVRQIKLRNLAGMILIDFIDMKSKVDETKVLNEMNRLIREDPIHSEVLGFTKLGIMEMTRKREGLDSFSLFCKSEKPQFSDREMVYQLERELLSYRKKETEAFLIEMSPEIFDVFLKNIDIEKLKTNLKIGVYVEKKTLENRHYVIKFIGDVNWLKSQESYRDTIDKLF